MNKISYLAALMMFPLFFNMSVQIYKYTIWDINVDGHLKRAADSNTVETAKEELKTALNYIEKSKKTEGDTGIFWSTPKNDVKFWYQNLKSSFEELNKTTPETTQLEKTNLLMKLRETLLDHKEKGDETTKPDGMYLYPNNAYFFAVDLISILLFLIAGFLLFKSNQKRSYRF